MSDKPTKEMPDGVIKLDIGCFTRKPEMTVKEMEEKWETIHKVMIEFDDETVKAGIDLLQETAEARGRRLYEFMKKQKR
jgi:hypothetical protein